MQCGDTEKDDDLHHRSCVNDEYDNQKYNTANTAAAVVELASSSYDEIEETPLIKS
jgi:hypothetical protein